MPRSVIERRLQAVTRRLQQARQELSVLDQQLHALAEEADDARVRALVSDDPMAQREHRQAQKHAEAMARSRAATVASIETYQRTLDELLDKLVVEPR